MPARARLYYMYYKTKTGIPKEKPEPRFIESVTIHDFGELNKNELIHFMDYEQADGATFSLNFFEDGILVSDASGKPTLRLGVVNGRLVASYPFEEATP
jgi:hypothetical protein